MVEENARVREEILREEEKKREDLLANTDQQKNTQKYKQLEFLLQVGASFQLKFLGFTNLQRHPYNEDTCLSYGINISTLLYSTLLANYRVASAS